MGKAERRRYQSSRGFLVDGEGAAFLGAGIGVVAGEMTVYNLSKLFFRGMSPMPSFRRLRR